MIKKKVAWLSAGSEWSSSDYLSNIILPALSEKCEVVAFVGSAMLLSYRVQDFEHTIFNVEGIGFGSQEIEDLLSQCKFEKDKTASAIIHQYLPKTKHSLLASMKSCLFSNERDMLESRLELPGTEVSYLPLPVELGYEPVEVAPVTKSRPLILAFQGGTGVEFRIEKVLKAVKTLSSSVRLLWLLDEEEKPEARNFLERSSISQVKLLSPKTFSNWQKICSASDAILLLNVSAVRGLGPALPLALASRKPVVVSDYGETELLPDSVVSKITAGYKEVGELSSVLSKIDQKRLVLEGGLMRSARSALDYVREVHDSGFIVDNVLHQLELDIRS